MTSGGARARSGPPRDGDRDRVLLPATGREGDAPAWPLPGRVGKFEREQWEELWTRPQAIMWERLNFEVDVALYVQAIGRAARGRETSTDRTNRLRMRDDLALSVGGLAKNGWRIAASETPPPAPRRASSSNAKDRLKLITGGNDARAS